MLSTLLDYEMGKSPDRPQSTLSTSRPTTPATPGSFIDCDEESQSVIVDNIFTVYP